jgi:cyclopropane-fatty-acyl-phospholipid synthase
MFLDADRQYSCAYFEHEGQSLDDAQLAKKRHIAAKLLVEPGHRVLDIGSGWGGLGLYLADFCGADVTGITLSTEQLAVSKSRAIERRLADHVDFRLQDYREVTEHFDRIVSVGMLEHVGVGYLDAYFRKVSELLAEDGVALIHTIGRLEIPGATDPWTDKYIFPGGYIPALSEVSAAIERSGLVVTDIEVLRLHYAETLKAWYDRFMAHRHEALALYDERFCRMWEYYLSGAEASFRVGFFGNFQLQLAHKVEAVPLTRDYIAERESDLRGRDTTSSDLRLAGE